MEYIARNIDVVLSDWVDDVHRKPLLLRGARQVGKSTSVRQLSKKFDYFLEVNFEQFPDIAVFFQGNLIPQIVCEKLSIYFGTPIIAGKTLLFFDEIQSCKEAIHSLRYFYEQYQELHVIAAGSLLEFALKDLSSFGVGRIRSVYLYPLSFNEFLTAMDEKLLKNEALKSSPATPISPVFHDKLSDYLKIFLLIGGMPEVVSNYVQTKNFEICRQILDDLISSLKTDFSKYADTVPSLRILEIFNSVAEQTGERFVYSNCTSEANHKQIKEALELLILAGLVIPITHTSANGIPLGAEINPKKQKMILLDTGIYQRILGLDAGEIVINRQVELVNKGALAEQFVGLEILKNGSFFDSGNLYFWTRESRGSNAEVDYLISRNAHIYPIEVKANTRGSMQSLRLFLDEKKSGFGIRCSSENFGEYDNIRVYPLYAVENILKQKINN